jgi:hypothetical protein
MYCSHKSGNASGSVLMNPASKANPFSAETNTEELTATIESGKLT